MSTKPLMSFLLDYSERSDTKFLILCLKVEADCQYLGDRVGEENQILNFKSSPSLHYDIPTFLCVISLSSHNKF